MPGAQTSHRSGTPSAVADVDDHPRFGTADIQRSVVDQFRASVFSMIGPDGENRPPAAKCCRATPAGGMVEFATSQLLPLRPA
jgi:hypothetical protein